MFVNYCKIVLFFSPAGGLIKTNIALNPIFIHTHDNKQKYILLEENASENDVRVHAFSVQMYFDCFGLILNKTAKRI